MNENDSEIEAGEEFEEAIKKPEIVLSSPAVDLKDKIPWQKKKDERYKMKRFMEENNAYNEEREFE